jgi:two-component system response regulator NreC
MNKTRVLIADQEGIVRAGLRLLLDAFPDVEVVAESDDGSEAIERAVKLLPDVLMIDVSRPGSRGLDVTRKLRRRAPAVRVLALTTQAEDYLLPALKAGVAGYVPKGAEPQELHLAIQALSRGHLFISPTVTRLVIGSYLRWHDARRLGDRSQRLTVREREVLHLVGQGRTNREMAGALRLSIKTIEKHRANLMSKLSLRDRTELMRYAAQQGLNTNLN